MCITKNEISRPNYSRPQSTTTASGAVGQELWSGTEYSHEERVVIGADFTGHVGEGKLLGKYGAKERIVERQVV